MNINSISGNSQLDTAKMKNQTLHDNDFEKYLKAASDGNNKEELKKVCKDFEGIFLNMMLKQMRATVQRSDLTQSDMGRDVFEGMLDEKLMDEASKGKGVGLADTLYRQLSRAMGNQYTPESVTKAAEIEQKE